MSSGSDETRQRRETPGARARALSELARELRQFNGLGASYFRAVAARAGMNATDAQALDILAATGPATAGRIAELMGVTTGAVSQMLDRLEQAGRIRRERDPEDGRRVIVRLAPGEDAARDLGPLLDAIGQRWSEVAGQYDDAQIALLSEFIRRANAVSRAEILRLREGPGDTASPFAAPLGDLTSGQLSVSSGSARLTLRADAAIAELYQARFEGSPPEVRVRDGVVTIRYPRQFWGMGSWQSAAEITLNAAIPWSIALQSKAAEITAELTNLDLASLEIKGGYSAVRLTLPAPNGAVPVRVSGGASMLTVTRPAGVAARVHLKGWVSQLTFDEQSIANAGEDVRLQSSGYETAGHRYDIEVSGAANVISVTAG
jgi:DNA-binding MarR family transcriptional regulator